jgi:hypothetical protein
MRTATLAQLRLDAKRRADMENGTFISDAEWDRLINQSITEYYDIVTQKFSDDYYYAKLNIQFVAGQDEYDLPTDFYKLLGVDLLISGDPTAATAQWATVKRYEHSDRNYFNNLVVRNALGVQPVRYRLQGNKIVIKPVPTTSGQYFRILYNPAFVDLVADDDEFDFVSGWEELPVIDAAIKALTKEESPTDSLMIQKQMLIKRIEEAAENRDANMPARVSDMRSGFFDDYYGQQF